MFSKYSLLLIAVTVTLPACGSDGGSEPGNGPDGTQAPVCSGAGKGIAVGLSQLGDEGLATFELVAANPAPPEQFDNTWTVKVSDSGGMPVAGAVTFADTWMPDHGHASPKAITTTELADGEYVLEPVNLFMPGLWEITVNAELSDGTVEKTVFSFCLNGEFAITGPQ